MFYFIVIWLVFGFSSSYLWYKFLITHDEEVGFGDYFYIVCLSILGIAGFLIVMNAYLSSFNNEGY